MFKITIRLFLYFLVFNTMGLNVEYYEIYVVLSAVFIKKSANGSMIK